MQAETLFGDWRLTAFISRGGTAEVYAAEHVSLGTPAAVKILLGTDPKEKGRKRGQTPGKWGQTLFRTGKMGTDPVSHIEKERFERKKLRFEQEARLLAGLNSPHFPSFYAFGEAHGYVYLAEELLEPGELPRGDRPRAKYVARRVPLPPSATSLSMPLPRQSVAGIGRGTDWLARERLPFSLW